MIIKCFAETFVFPWTNVFKRNTLYCLIVGGRGGGANKMQQGKTFQHLLNPLFLKSKFLNFLFLKKIFLLDFSFNFKDLHGLSIREVRLLDFLAKRKNIWIDYFHHFSNIFHSWKGRHLLGRGGLKGGYVDYLF